MLRSVGRLACRRPAIVLVAWFCVLVAGLGYGPATFSRLTSDDTGDTTLESVEGLRLFTEAAPHGPRLLAVVDGVDATAPTVRAAVVGASRQLRGVAGVAAVRDPYQPALPALVARDGTALLVAVDLTKDLPEDAQDAAAGAVRDRLGAAVDGLPGAVRTARPAPRVLVGGDPVLRREAGEQVARDLATGEAYSLPLALLTLMIVFGGLRAAWIPLAAAVVSIAGTLLVLLCLTGAMSLSPDVPSVVTVLGLGLAVDYGLLLVSRFREELGEDVGAAVARTVDTAGRAVAFSGLTVMASLCGLLVFPAQLFRSIAVAGMAIVLLAMAVALTLVPAVLALVGHRLSPRRGAHRRVGRLAALAAPPPEDGFFSRLTRRVQRRPWLVLLGVAGLLVMLGLPFLRVEYRQNDLATVPERFASRQVADLVAQRFAGAATDGGLVVVSRTAADDARLAAFEERVAALPGVRAVGRRPDASPGLAVTDVVVAGGAQGETAQRLVDRVRAERPPFPTYVTGHAAYLVDLRGQIAATLPYAVGIIAAVTLLLLFLLTGSLLVPVKALLMNVLSLGASFGALVWVFQDGNLSGPLGFTATGAIELWVPVIVFVFAFGLSMDYEVFLLARIKELRDAGLDSAAAVALGLQRSGRIITSAAVLIVVVFAGFVGGQMLGIKQLGLALLIAVVVDVTLVRCLLVPAAMTLLGDLNWWAPAPLRRWHDRFGFRESADARPPTRPPPRHRYSARHTRPSP